MSSPPAGRGTGMLAAAAAACGSPRGLQDQLRLLVGQLFGRATGGVPTKRHMLSGLGIVASIAAGVYLTRRHFRELAESRQHPAETCVDKALEVTPLTLYHTTL